MTHRPLLFLLCAAAAIPATAAPTTDPDTRRVFEDYTACVVKAHPKDAAEVVLSTLSGDKILKAYPNLLSSDCLDPVEASQLQFPSGEFVRYGLAEQLVRREFAGGLPSDFGLAGPIHQMELDESSYQPKSGEKATPRLLAQLQQYKERDLATRTLSLYGECVARADPAGALALVLSDASSREEAAAFTRLQPALSSCLVKGTTIQLDKAAIRGSIAMNLYRLAKAPRVPTSAAAK
jgi:hypothetical protein